jgi:two-component system, sensor histidine kinase
MFMDFQVHNRIDHITRMIFEIANGNFDYQVERSGNEDELDAIVVGINMLREELKATTVSRDYMDNLFRGMVDLIFILDHDYNIQSVNEAVEELLGIGQQYLVGKNFMEVVDDHSRPVVEGVKANLAFRKFRRDIELTLKIDEERSIPASGSFSVLFDKMNQKSGILIVAKDISRLKQAEAEMRRAKEFAEAANLAKSRFLANMSHEIRTPLNGILGLTEIMLSDIKDPVQREYLQIMRTSGRSLTGLINDILDLSKIESGKLSLERSTFAFSETVHRNIQQYRHLAEQKGLNFSCTIDDKIPAYLVGDPTRINQIVVNLVSNAIKFTEKGSIDVAFFREREEGGEITLRGTVSDTGVGIARENMKKIFESFAQADDSVTRKYGGTGLGLTIVENLLKQMGGSINVQSPYAKDATGTQFTFSFKVSAAPEAPEKPAAEDEAAKKVGFDQALNVLVVDDNVLKILENLGARVTRAESGAEAISLAKANTFDIIFMDIQMPDMDGYAVATALRAQNYANPIIALSANAYAEHVAQSIAAGMDGHLQKPFTPQEIHLITNKFLAHKMRQR